MIINKKRGFRADDELVVQITDVTDRGLGRGEIEAYVGPQKEHVRYDIFVRKAIPGDTVRVQIEYIRRRRCTAHILEMIESSSLRIKPACPHFGRRELVNEGCGGCTFQSISYRHQLAIKERLVKDRIKEAGLDPGLVFPPKATDDPWYYRNKMEFSFGDTANREFALGLHPTGYKFDIVNLESCHLQSEFSSKFIALVRRWAVEKQLRPCTNAGDDGVLLTLTIREGKRTGERMVELMTTDADRTTLNGDDISVADVAKEFKEFALATAAELGDEITSIYWTRKRVKRGERTQWFEKLLYGREVVREELHLPGDRKLRFDIHPRAFFQTNTLGAEILYREVIEQAGIDDKIGVSKVLDLYCGTGTIGLCLAPFATQVVGIEMQRDAVENAKQNAELNSIDNIEFFAGDVGRVLNSEEFSDHVDDVDLTIVDPPRKGLLGDSIEHILAIKAPRLIYVSCNPSSLAQDLVELIDGGYELEMIQPIDMFPQTYHVESVAVLRRN